MRSTQQRAAIRNALDRAGGFRSAQQLHDDLRRKGKKVGIATVYRSLHSMAEQGDVDALRGSDGSVRYRSCRQTGHHHHLVCRDCGLSVEVEDRKLENWALATARRHGFSDPEHTVELFGRCRSCAKDI